MKWRGMGWGGVLHVPECGGGGTPASVETLSLIWSDKSSFYRPCWALGRDRAGNEEDLPLHHPSARGS